MYRKMIMMPAEAVASQYGRGGDETGPRVDGERVYDERVVGERADGDRVHSERVYSEPAAAGASSVPKGDATHVSQSPYYVTSVKPPAKHNEIKKKIERSQQKPHNLIRIALKLAQIGGYDVDGHVLASDGTPIANSDIVALINHSMSDGKALFGEEEFINLLRRADVDPELIYNENIKSKLINAKSSIPLRRVAKRRREDEEPEPIKRMTEHEYRRKKAKWEPSFREAWETPLPSDNFENEDE
jgi:hypothetical protein